MVAKKTAAKKAAAGKTAAKKTAAKKTAAKRTATAKATDGTVEKAAAAEATGKKDVAGKPAAGGAPAKKSAAKKAAPHRAASGSTAKKAASAADRAAEAAEQTGAKTVAAKKTAGRGTAAGAGGTGVATAVTTEPGAPTPPDELAVRPGEEPWTPEEVAEARSELESEIARLQAEITASETSLAGLMRDSGDGAGDDDADTGTKNITREHEMSLAANAREMLEQTERALLRLDAGTYGLCEICGKPIGKARMQAFPRATLCVEDKQKQERRG